MFKNATCRMITNGDTIDSISCSYCENEFGIDIELYNSGSFLTADSCRIELANQHEKEYIVIPNAYMTMHSATFGTRIGIETDKYHANYFFKSGTSAVFEVGDLRDVTELIISTVDNYDNRLSSGIQVASSSQPYDIDTSFKEKISLNAKDRKISYLSLSAREVVNVKKSKYEARVSVLTDLAVIPNGHLDLRSVNNLVSQYLTYREFFIPGSTKRLELSIKANNKMGIYGLVVPSMGGYIRDNKEIGTHYAINDSYPNYLRRCYEIAKMSKNTSFINNLSEAIFARKNKSAEQRFLTLFKCIDCFKPDGKKKDENRNFLYFLVPKRSNRQSKYDELFPNLTTNDFKRRVCAIRNELSHGDIQIDEKKRLYFKDGKKTRYFVFTHKFLYDACDYFSYVIRDMYFYDLLKYKDNNCILRLY